MYRRLFIWVEGDRDVRLVERVLKPRLLDQYDWVEVREYSQLTTDKVVHFIESIRAMQDAEYIFVADLDSAPCVTERRGSLVQSYKSVEPDHVLIVKPEIEAWYVAGLDANSCRLTGVPASLDAETVTKERFASVCEKIDLTPLQLMPDILETYSLDVGVTRNSSLAYFVRRQGW